MTDLLLNLVNVSITASVVAVAVILLRLLFKKSPRWVTCLLWALVGLRLLFPFAPESRFSLIPNTYNLIGNTYQPPEVLKPNTSYNTIDDAVNNHYITSIGSEQTVGVTDVLTIVWFSVAALMLLYGIISYLMMYSRVRTAIPLKDNLYQSECVKSPFVLGFVKPKIYIPFNITGKTLKYVLAHENAHIKRKDHVVKPFAYLLLCFHWFNPLMWISFILLCRDIEVACDERVIKNYSLNQRKNYAFALLECKVKHSGVAVSPVAFGEVDVSARIRKTLSYKKPAMWLTATAIFISVVASGCLLTNPEAESYYVEMTLSETETTDIISEVNNTGVSTNFATEGISETTPAPTEETTTVNDISETEASTQANTTEAFEEPTAIIETQTAYSSYYSETNLPSVPSSDEYFNEKMEAEGEVILARYYNALLKDTSNHSDECLCPSCDKLREAGFYPILNPEIPAPTTPIYTFSNESYQTSLLSGVTNSSEFQSPTLPVIE